MGWGWWWSIPASFEVGCLHAATAFKHQTSCHWSWSRVPVPQGSPPCHLGWTSTGGSLAVAWLWAAVLMFYVPSMGVSFPLLGRTRVLSCSRAGVLEVPSGVGTGMLHCDPAA